MSATRKAKATQRYAVQVWELMASTIYVDATTAVQAAEAVRDSARPPGCVGRIIKHVSRARSPR